MPPADPPNLRLHPDLERVVDAARADVGDAARLQAIAARLGPQLSAAPAVAASWVPHVIVGALVAGGVTIAVVRGAHRPVISHVSTPATASVPTSQPPSPQEPWVVATTPALTPTAPAPSSQGSTARPGRTTPGVPAAATRTVDPVLQEHEILAQARRSLDVSPADTLARVAEHERSFPDGALASERELLRVMALARLGRLSEARAARDAFLARWPTSAYRDEINRLLGP